jgi:hypothetical protein
MVPTPAARLLGFDQFLRAVRAAGEFRWPRPCPGGSTSWSPFTISGGAALLTA